jgi:hypothetical protein
VPEQDAPRVEPHARPAHRRSERLLRPPRRMVLLLINCFLVEKQKIKAETNDKFLTDFYNIEK